MKSTLQPHPHDIVFSGISHLQKDVFFLQIGAADGRRYDPVYHFVRRYGWMGVLVEPLPDIFEMLQANYQGQDNLVFENAAVTEKDETRKIHRIPLESVGDGNVPGWAFGASTLVPEKTRFARRNSPAPLHDALSSAAVVEEVQCLSLTTLLAKHSVQRIDVLQLDTEGYDARILRQLDLERYRPAVINMEWQWLDESERNEISSRLIGEGYALHGCEADLLATSGPLQKFVVPSRAPDADAAPRFFPSIVGYSVETGVDEETGASSRQATRIEFRRARGTRFSVPGQPALAAFLANTNGRRTYRQLADGIGCPLGVLLEWGRQLQSLYVIESASRDA